MPNNLLNSFLKPLIAAALMCCLSLAAHCQQDSARIKNDNTNIDSIKCSQLALPDIPFISSSLILTKTITAMLDSAAKLLKANPHCMFTISDYNVLNTERGQQESWDRVYTVLMYLRKKGVSPKQLIFMFGDTGNNYAVSFAYSRYGGPPMVPIPHPQYSHIKNLPIVKIMAEYNTALNSQ